MAEWLALILQTPVGLLWEIDMKAFVVGLLIVLFFGGLPEGISAAITERVIYAGDTPLESDCQVTQTGPMEITVMPCFWTTTGEARILTPSIIEWAAAKLGQGAFGRAIGQNRAEWMPDNKRIRGWLVDSQGNIIERSVTYRLGQLAVLTITAGQKYRAYMVDGPGNTMTIFLMDPIDPLPFGFINYLIFKFDVPAGTTDLSTVTLEVFTVRPDFPPAKGLFEK